MNAYPMMNRNTAAFDRVFTIPAERAQFVPAPARKSSGAFVSVLIVASVLSLAFVACAAAGIL